MLETKSNITNLDILSIRCMAEADDFNSGVELNDIAVSMCPRRVAEWFASADGDMQLPAILTLSTAVVGLSTQCPISEYLPLVTTVAECDDDGGSNDDPAADTDDDVLTTEGTNGQLLL